MKDKIRFNIEQFGRHVYCVLGGESPRYLYTIGLGAKVGFELVFAGQVQIPSQTATKILNTMARELESGTPLKTIRVDTQEFGSFTLSESHPTWAQRMILGALDYYDREDMPLVQVLPEPDRATIDIPPMQEPFDPQVHRVWQWLEGGWPYEVSADTVVMTNLDALQGYAISELVRWEKTDWQMFSGAGSAVADDELIQLPLATLIGFDKSLEAALDLEISTGLYREFDEHGEAGDWKVWLRES